MTGSTKVAIGLGVLCALLLGVMIGGRLGGGAESEHYFARANRALDSLEPKPPAKEDEKTVLTKAAKALTTALAIYAGDSDDLLPSPFGFSERVRPYASSEAQGSLDHAEWTFREGRCRSFEGTTNETEAVRMRGKTGTAVGYQNGIVKWQPK